MITKKSIKPGARVLITGSHPWSGHSGEFLRFEATPFGERPIVKLDNGQQCFVMDPTHWKKLPVGK